MYPLFINLKDSSVFILGHSQNALKYAKIFSEITKVYYFSSARLEPQDRKFLKSLPGCELYEKRLPYAHLLRSKLLVAASEVEEENSSIIQKAAAGFVPFIAAVRPYANVNVFLGETLSEDGIDVGVYSKNDGLSEDIIKTIDIEKFKKHPNWEKLQDLVEELYEETAYSDVNDKLTYALKPEEVDEFLEVYKKEYKNLRDDIRIRTFVGDFETSQAGEVAEALDGEMEKDELYQDIIVSVVENPMDLEDSRAFYVQARRIQDELIGHEYDILLTKDSTRLNVAPGLKKIVGINKRGPIKHYVIGKQEQKVDNFFEIPANAKIGYRNLKAFEYLLDQEVELAQIYHGKEWDLEAVETFSEVKNAIGDIGISYDYLLIDGAELRESGITEDVLNKEDLFVLEVDMTPVSDQPILNAYVRKTDRYLIDILENFQDDATKKAVEAQDLIYEELFDLFDREKMGPTLYTYAQYDPKQKTYQLEAVGELDKRKKFRVKLEDVKEEDLISAIRKMYSIARFDLTFGDASLTDYTRRHLDELKGNLTHQQLFYRTIFTLLEQQYETFSRLFYEQLLESFRTRMQENMTQSAEEKDVEIDDLLETQVDSLIQEEVEERLEKIKEDGVEVYLFP